MKIVGLDSLGAHLPPSSGGEPRIVVAGNYATPTALLFALDSCIERYRLVVLNAQPPLPRRAGVTYESAFLGPATRDAGAQLRYLPMRLSLVPTLLSHVAPPDIVLIHTSMPIAGRVSLGIEVNVLPAAIEAARRRGGLVVAQINPSMPYVFGDGELTTDLIDLAVEVPAALASPQSQAREDRQADAIAANVAELIRDGATLQLGIGAIPDRVLGHLASRRGLRVWSEMISDGILRLEQRGALDPMQPIVASFLFGSPELYAWADRNPRLRLLRTETVNDPSTIMRHDAMTAVNAAIEVDLHAQANASHIGARTISGFGGQPDFTVGALHAPGGQSIIAVRAWHLPSDRSSVVPALATPVTSFQHSAFVSEHGVAHLFGASALEQADAIVTQVADPRARDELRAAAAWPAVRTIR